MSILRSSRELSPAEKYALTLSPGVQKMKDAVSQEIEISAYCLYTDTNSKGEDQEILAICTPENESFATNSPTFKEDFFKMIDAFSEWGQEVHVIKVITGKSKADRDFITCVYVS